jgi:hypothetical protein
MINTMITTTNPRTNVQTAINTLDAAVALHTTIAGVITVKDSANAYQRNWRLALGDLLANHATDFDYLALLA